MDEIINGNESSLAEDILTGTCEFTIQVDSRSSLQRESLAHRHKRILRSKVQHVRVE
jgi:hypothetical protein